MSQFYNREMRQDLVKERLLRITLAVHRVTALLPEEELLGQKIRESADKILADLLLRNDENSLRGMKIMQEFLNAAQEKSWVDSRNFLVLKREYDKIQADLKPDQKPVRSKDLTKARQKKILGLLQENGRVKLGDLASFFPGTNRRTLQRDLENFVLVGAAERNGDGRGAYYTSLKMRHNA